MAIGATCLMSTHQERETTTKNNNNKEDDESQAEAHPPPLVDSHENDVVMPGFRFHPTEEELIEFYLRRKVEGQRFNIELITFLDLYRYDPWELPALAAIGEKEWYFYVPRDKKYRNGDRPNRVTKSGYWKATGADRMIRSESFQSIGIKKTLVFYSGKAPKGIRTGWTMNEYRLPIQETERLQKAEISLCRVYKRAGIEDHPSLPRPIPKTKGSKNQTHPANQTSVTRPIQDDEQTMLFLQFKQTSRSSTIYPNSSPNNVDDLHKLVNGASYRHQESSSISESHENRQFSTSVGPIDLISYLPNSQLPPQTTTTTPSTNPSSLSQVTFPWDWNTIHEGSKDFTTLFK